MRYVFSVWLTIIVFLISCSNGRDTCDYYMKEENLIKNKKHEKLFDKEEYNKAIAEVKKIIKSDSNNYVAINYLGAYKYELCKKDECSPIELKEVYGLYKKSIEICYEYRIGHFNLIEVLSELQNTKYKNDQELIQSLEFYNSKYKKRSNLLTKGGQAMFRFGKIDKALNYLNEALRIDSTEAMAYIYKGKCNNSRRKWRSAIDELNKGLALDSLSLGFHERAYAKYKLRDLKGAEIDYRQAISLFNERFESYSGLGQIEVKRGNIDLACQYFTKAKEIAAEHGENVELWLREYCLNSK